MVMAVGLGMDHRSFEPATPLGTAVGMDLGVSLALFKPPASLSVALENTFSNVLSGSSSANFSDMNQLVFPSLRLQLHKGIGNRVDIGISALPLVKSIPGIGGSYFYGAEIKACLFRPEEGPTISARVSYNINYLQVNAIEVSTNTITPSILISRKMGFADPYLGMSLQYATGSLKMSLSPSSLPGAYASLLSGLPQVVLTQTGRSYAGNFFGGVSFKFPYVGINLVLEGAYNTANMNYVGTKIGFAF